MTPRDEYMTILAAMCVTDCEINPTRMAAFALDLWREGDFMWRERGPVVAQPPTKPDECRDGCPQNQVCDFCQGTGGKDKGVAA